MDLAAADLLWSFFSSALESYRRDSVLRPFPKDFMNSDGEKDFERLSSLVRQCPALSIVNEKSEEVSSELLKLMRWVLNPKHFVLKQHALDEFKEIYSSVAVVDEHGFAKVPKPNFIFEVLPSYIQEESFRRLRGDMKLLYGFHGSRIENFYSILNFGLRNNLNKVGLYGEGIYLSSDLTIAMSYSPTGQGWQHSIFGRSMSCLAVCEMIDHPDVKCTVSVKTEARANAPSDHVPMDGNVRKDSTTCFSSMHRSGSLSRHRSRIKGSEGGEIPEKYFVVRNDELVRVKYLLLYCPAGVRRLKKVNQRDKVWVLAKHRFFIVMLMYIFILLLASFLGSRVFKEWWRGS